MFKRAVWRCSGCGAHFVKILGVYTTLGKEFSSPGPSKELAATYNQTLRLLIARHALHLDPVGKRPSPDAVFLAWYLWGDAHLQDRLTRSQTRSPRTTADWMGMPGKIYQVQSMLGAFQVLLLWPRSMWRAQLESFWRTTGRSEKGLREFWAAHDLDDLDPENLSAFSGYDPNAKQAALAALEQRGPAGPERGTVGPTELGYRQRLVEKIDLVRAELPGQ